MRKTDEYRYSLHVYNDLKESRDQIPKIRPGGHQVFP